PISVTVVTKPARRELEAPEPVETLAAPSTPELPPVETPRVPSPKPFVKLEGTFALEKDQVASPPLQLKGLGLGGVDNSKSDSSDAKQSKLKSGEEITPSPSKVLQSALSVRVPARHSRRRAPQEAPSSSSTEFTLRGARLTAPMTNEVKSIEKPKEVTGFEAMAPLSKAQRERLWHEFAAEPLSASVHEAYSILYPQTYALPAAATEHQGDQGAQPALVSSVASRKSSSSQSPSSLLALRVDSTRQPLQNAMELDRKFWSAVEGYRAIGSSSLVPLDAATIAQRRHDKARAIYDQFFCGQRTNSACCDHRGLALAWLDMYPKEVADVRRLLPTAPRGLFDALQRTAELQLSAALAKHHVDEALG
ncbi:hypothetical protein PR001_g31541, partial [Phytophthora rubi]